MRLSPGSAKTAELDGARLPSADSLRRELPALIFTPDRLAVVKGGPAARRAYFDRVFSRLQPARAALPSEYAATLAQRNAALRRVQLRLSSRDALEPWTERLAELGARLVEARRELLSELAPGFAERDVARGSTGAGPHLDDVRIASAGRDLRAFGSQGEQRLALLALLLAEAELVPSRPLLLLDDVLSELDGRRRAVLAERIGRMEQTVVTATHRSALPAEPAQIVEVRPGQAV
jgi:DNA replication and repair protein RecF